MVSKARVSLRREMVQTRVESSLSLVAFAGELRIRPEWLSKILNGHVKPSYNVGLRYDEFRRRHGFALDRPVQKDVRSRATVLREAILQQCKDLIDDAEMDLEKLNGLLQKLAALRYNSRRRDLKEAETSHKRSSGKRVAARDCSPPRSRTLAIKERCVILARERGDTKCCSK